MDLFGEESVMLDGIIVNNENEMDRLRLDKISVKYIDRWGLPYVFK